MGGQRIKLHLMLPFHQTVLRERSGEGAENRSSWEHGSGASPGLERVSMQDLGVGKKQHRNSELLRLRKGTCQELKNSKSDEHLLSTDYTHAGHLA